MDIKYHLNLQIKIQAENTDTNNITIAKIVGEIVKL